MTLNIIYSLLSLCYRVVKKFILQELTKSFRPYSMVHRGGWIPDPSFKLVRGQLFFACGRCLYKEPGSKFYHPSSKILDLRTKWEKNLSVGIQIFHQKSCENTKEILSSDFKMDGKHYPGYVDHSIFF